MIYILCEDEGSGFKFFKYMRDAYGFTESDCKIETSRGNQNYASYMKKVIFPLLIKGDKLLLVFDNIGIVGNFNPFDIVGLAQNTCSLLGVDLFLTDYYCFEELFLSYKYLYTMLDLNIKEQKKLIDLQNKIFSGISYKNWDTSFWVNLSPKNFDTSTRETFSSSLLFYLTDFRRKKNMHIKINKSYMDKCWVMSCKDITTDDKHNLGKGKLLKSNCMSNNCTFCKNMLTAKEKIAEIDSNSIASSNYPFAKLFE